MVSGNAQVLPKRREYIYRALPFVLSIVAFLFYTLWNEVEAVWYDEVFTLSVIRHSWGKIVEYLSIDVQSPLYYFLIKLYGIIFGNSIGVLRSFSALGVIATAMLGFGPLKRLLGREVGVIFAILWLILPVNFSRAMEMRMYTMTAFFVMGAVLYGFLLMKESSIKDWIKFSIFSIAGMYMHYYALLAILFFWVFFFLLILLRKDRERLKFILIFGGIVALLYAPWIYVFFKQMNRVHEVLYISKITFGKILRLPFSMFMEKFSDIYFIPTFVFLSVTYVILTSWGIYSSLVSGEKEVFFVLLGLLLFFMMSIAQVLIYFFFHSCFSSRYIYFVTPFQVLGMVWGIKKLNRDKFKLLSLIFISIVVFPELFFVLSGVYYMPVREAVSYLKERVKEGDVFVHLNQMTGVVFSYYFKDNPHIVYISPWVNNKIYYKTHKIYEPEITFCSNLMRSDLIGKDIWLVYDSYYQLGCKILLKEILKKECEQKEELKIFRTSCNKFDVVFVRVSLKKEIVSKLLLSNENRLVIGN